ncbi:hypothetical protein HELRODRAFT_194812 [Helobdella robusta]|uniref:G-protein coupled receptors family 1 profile domain-containing protein n=1 Tax=Helobdella robusta TaxID=6412 RepID=T1FWF9_HELRO|nr:hypothetical protein HELRODRAFT_194812 [Helobdella robusta]ESO11422.1 hypothetical protein HELRODRAFT_194812 [Helobdella robusta]
MYLYKNNTICNCSTVEVSDENITDLFQSTAFQTLLVPYTLLFILSLIANSILLWFLTISARTCCNALLLSYTICSLILTLTTPLSNQLIVYNSSFIWSYISYTSLLNFFALMSMASSVMFLTVTKYELVIFKKTSRSFSIFKVLTTWLVPLLGTLLVCYKPDMTDLFFEPTTPEIVPCDCTNLPVDRWFEVYYLPLVLCFVYLVELALFSLIHGELWYLLHRRWQADRINCREPTPELSCTLAPLDKKSDDEAQDLENKSIPHAILLSAVTYTFYLLIIPLEVFIGISLFRPIYMNTSYPTVAQLLELACLISTPIYFNVCEPKFFQALRKKTSCRRSNTFQPVLVQY